MQDFVNGEAFRRKRFKPSTPGSTTALVRTCLRRSGRWVNWRRLCNNCLTVRDCGIVRWRTSGLHERWTTTTHYEASDNSSTTQSYENYRTAWVGLYISARRATAVGIMTGIGI